MKKLYASNDKTKYAKVDDDVFETIQEMKLKFRIQPNGYFRSNSHIIQLPGMNKKKQLLLHHFVLILKTGEKHSSEVDHADRNKSNNQFSNLRLATRKEQCQHKSKMKNNTSGLIGVCHKHNVDKRYKNGYRDYWLARIKKPDGKREIKHFPFTDEGKIAAGKWRDAKAREYFGDFHGQLNFPDETA